jgi:hypothetical protein
MHKLQLQSKVGDIQLKRLENDLGRHQFEERVKTLRFNIPEVFASAFCTISL